MNKHIVSADTSKPIHSSVFAQVANGDRLGSTTSVSFNQRQYIDQSRRVIGNYRRSTLSNSYAALRAKTYDNPISISPLRSQRGSLQQHNSLNVAPRQFTEPPLRKYNPYS